MQKISNIRLFVTDRITLGQPLSLSENQAHYLSNVMRRSPGDCLYCLDNQTGEYLAKISALTKKTAELNILKKTRDFHASPDVWLLFAPLKKDNTDFVIQKATELGVRKIIPVSTKNAISEKIKKERFISQAIEASEQCRRLDLPEVEDIVPLSKILLNWDPRRTLFFMDETLSGQSVFNVFSGHKQSASALLVGPEGGFSPDELGLLRSLPFAKAVTLGPRILRAETATLAALACWQAIAGDWSDV